MRRCEDGRLATQGCTELTQQCLSLGHQFMLLRKLSHSKHLELGVVAHNFTPALGRQRQILVGFKASQSYTLQPCLTNKESTSKVAILPHLKDLERGQ